MFDSNELKIAVIGAGARPKRWRYSCKQVGVRVAKAQTGQVESLWIRHSRASGDPGQPLCRCPWTPAFAGVTVGVAIKGDDARERRP